MASGDKLKEEKYRSNIDKLTKSMEILARGLTSAVSNPAANAGKLSGSAIGGMGAPADAVGKMLAPVTKSLEGMAGSLQGIFGPIASMVEHINPMIVQQFSLVMNDLLAVMGDALQPILEAGIKLIRLFADTLEGLRPVLDPLIQVFVQLIGLFGELIRPLVEVFAPIIQLITALLQTLMPLFQFLAKVISNIADAVSYAIKLIIKAYNSLADTWAGRRLGMKKIELQDTSPKDSTGKALRSVSRMSAEDIGIQTRNAALGQTNWAQATAEASSKIAENTGAIVVMLAQGGINAGIEAQLAKMNGAAAAGGG